MSVELTFREKKTLETLKTLSAHDLVPTVREVAHKGFPTGGKRSRVQADRIVRNSLRRLIKLGLVERKARGEYVAAAEPVQP